MKKLFLSLGLLVIGSGSLQAITFDELTDVQKRAAQDMVNYLRTTDRNQGLTVQDLSQVQLEEIVANDMRDQARRERAAAKKAALEAQKAMEAAEVARVEGVVAHQARERAEQEAAMAALMAAGLKGTDLQLENFPVAPRSMGESIVGDQKSNSQAQLVSLERAKVARAQARAKNKSSVALQGYNQRAARLEAEARRLEMEREEVEQRAVERLAELEAQEFAVVMEAQKERTKDLKKARIERELHQAALLAREEEIRESMRKLQDSNTAQEELKKLTSEISLL